MPAWQLAADSRQLTDSAATKSRFQRCSEKLVLAEHACADQRQMVDLFVLQFLEVTIFQLEPLPLLHRALPVFRQATAGVGIAQTDQGCFHGTPSVAAVASGLLLLLSAVESFKTVGLQRLNDAIVLKCQDGRVIQSCCLPAVASRHFDLVFDTQAATRKHSLASCVGSYESDSKFFKLERSNMVHVTPAQLTRPHGRSRPTMLSHPDPQGRQQPW